MSESIVLLYVSQRYHISVGDGQEEISPTGGGQHRRVEATRSATATDGNNGGGGVSQRRERRRKHQRRATITGAWAELHNIEASLTPPTEHPVIDDSHDNSTAGGHKPARYDSDLALDRGRMLANLLLKVCPPAAMPPSGAEDKPVSSNHHSPSDQGIYMDSGSDVAKTTDGSGGRRRGGGSDSAHSSTHSPSTSTTGSSSSSCSSSSSLSVCEEAGIEEAVSLAYIDESKTVHKYIASRYI